ncbi:quinone oxidoreductase family protein [Marinigracilibium pacificum]|uniref:Quinone oxidoreductase n=1 Tax=Marinigracilibium pacificum TaxID=2729599 RepID=A0A848J4Q0_9BACT|nr:quinone oxidoreductase [Marinigracilibium pacificum]NMM50696.1 quinone oxidoreductase [Marinigracilibium pacificum]
MKALTFSEFGEADVLKYIEVPDPEISENEILIKNKAIGLNFADIYRRKGNYHLKGTPPFIAGYEGAGTVIKSNSDKFKIGDNIAYTDVPFANAELISIPEAHAIPIPENVDFNLASSALLQGLTAQYLANNSYYVTKDDTVLIHAASGGVGQILTQFCKLKGATVIGLTRSEDKLETIFSCKADYAILLDSNWKTKVIEITNNIGVDVVYDSVGSTLMDSFDVTKDCGSVVFYGMSGGDPAPVDPRMLMDTSKSLIGGDLWSYLVNEEERRSRANNLFDLISKGQITIKEPVKFKLSEGKKAHEYLESGKSSSKVILIPDSI